MDHCLYYQAHVNRKDCWFLVGILRSFENMTFDRTLDKEKSIFEFYVPVAMKDYFEALLAFFMSENIIYWYREMANRLLIDNACL